MIFWGDRSSSGRRLPMKVVEATTMTNYTEKLTHDVLAACGMISERAAEPLPLPHEERMRLFTNEVREAAEIAEEHHDRVVAGTLYAFLGHMLQVNAGQVYGGLAARAAFGYRHRLLEAEQRRYKAAEPLVG